MPHIIDCHPGLVAVFKPRGMLVHRQYASQAGPFLLQWLRDELGQHVFPIHRLDRPTAGLLVFALSKKDAAALSEQFREKLVTKRYIAVVRGYLAPEGTIDYALRPINDRFSKSHPDRAQEARTRYRLVERTELAQPVGRYQTARYSLVELFPETGRRHQLRRHMKHIFHPILGDRKYGDRDHNRFQEEELGLPMLALCSVGLTVRDPTTGKQLALQIAPDPDLTLLAENLGFSPPW